jgi:hypothetical protein
VHEDVVKIRGRHDGEAISDDRVVGVVAVQVDQDFAVGRSHLGEAFCFPSFCVSRWVCREEVRRCGRFFVKGERCRVECRMRSRLTFTKKNLFTDRWQQRIFRLTARGLSLTMRKSVNRGLAHERQ